MGDPRKQKKKYSKPRHPWQAARLEEEAKLIKDYALKNKKELWKAASLLKKFRRKSKEITASRSEQAKKEESQLLNKLVKLKLLPPNSKIEDILEINITVLLERRIQTIVYKKELARTSAQARQMIVHGHIAIKGQKVDIPSYLVSEDEEQNITFTENSPFKNEDHPELVIKKEKKTKETDKLKEQDKIKEEIIEKEIKTIEILE